MPLRKIIRAGLFLLPVVIYLPTFGGNAAVPPGTETYSDLLITHYPYLLYLRDSILTNSQVPLWSTLIHSGAPFAANPLAGVFYLPGWLAMLFPLPAGISLVVAAHVVFGTWGMYGFLRKRDVGETGSVLGALGFGLMPKLAAHFGAGHVTLIYAVAWTPWLLYCAEQDLKGWKAGMVAGMLFLADPRWSVYAGALWISYEIAHRQYAILNRIWFYLKASLIAVLIGAPLLIPMLEYVQLATRVGLTSGDILYGSLPLTSLIGLIIPGSSGNTEWYLYAGGVILGLFTAQLFNKKLRKINRFWIAWVVISLVLALGTWGIEVGWITKIPILRMLRVPARSLFVTGICFAAIGGTTVDHLAGGVERIPSLRKTNFGIIALGLTFMAGMAYITKAKPVMILWGFSFFTASGLLLMIIYQNPTRRFIEWIIAGFLVVDLLGAGLTSFVIQNKAIREPGVIYNFLKSDESYFRIYSPSYSVKQYLAAEGKLELSDGVDPMQLANYAAFMERATGVSLDGYSVTIPPFKTGNPTLDNIDARPDSELLGLLNVKYVISEFEIDADGFIPLPIEGAGIIYLNEDVMTRAWIESPGQDQGELNQLDVTEARIVDKTANKITLKASGPGKLVLSEIDYPGWRVYIDGVQEEISPAYGLLRSVSLDDGDHKIVFVFRPISVYIGLALAGVGWVALVYLYFRKRFN